jgi:hypothetical protein
MTMSPYASSDSTQRRLAEIERKLRESRLPEYTVLGAPSAATVGAGVMAYFSNGAAGSPVVAFSNGTNWLRCDTLAVVS